METIMTAKESLYTRTRIQKKMMITKATMAENGATIKMNTRKSMAPIYKQWKNFRMHQSLGRRKFSRKLVKT